jgi:hypothetical protein
MKQHPAIILIGRQFMEMQSMSLDLVRGLGALRVDTEKVKVIYSGSIKYRTGGITGVAENVSMINEIRDIVVIKDTEDAIMNLKFEGFGEKYDPRNLRETLLDLIDVFHPNTVVAKGEEFHITLRPNADLSQLNRPAFRKSPAERMVEDTEVKKLLDRGILEPSISPYGTSNVLVPKKPLPDGTPGGYG